MSQLAPSAAQPPLPACPRCHEGRQLVDASGWVCYGNPDNPDDWDLVAAQDEVACDTCGGLGQITLPQRTRLLLQVDRSARRLRH